VFWNTKPSSADVYFRDNSYSSFSLWRNNLLELRPIHCWSFEIIKRHTTLGRTSLEEWSARSRDHCRTTHGAYNRQIYTVPAEFEQAIPESERPQSYVSDRFNVMCILQQLQKLAIISPSTQLKFIGINFI
jgi:hypothetical protein